MNTKKLLLFIPWFQTEEGPSFPVPFRTSCRRSKCVSCLLTWRFVLVRRRSARMGPWAPPSPRPCTSCSTAPGEGLATALPTRRMRRLHPARPESARPAMDPRTGRRRCFPPPVWAGAETTAAERGGGRRRTWLRRGGSSWRRSLRAPRCRRNPGNKNDSLFQQNVAVDCSRF